MSLSESYLPLKGTSLTFTVINKALMIKQCTEMDFDDILRIINQAAGVYRNVVPQDCLHEPYMSQQEFAAEIAACVNFLGYFSNSKLIGVMGIQQVRDAYLIRHAYVLREYQRKSVGEQLIKFLLNKVQGTILVGTWAAAVWAIRFYESNGFQLTSTAEKDRLLDLYWKISSRQVETSVVLRYVGDE